MAKKSMQLFGIKVIFQVNSNFLKLCEDPDSPENAAVSIPQDEEFYEGMGVFFVELTAKLGFSALLSRLGRTMRDFLLNLDNLHDYLRYHGPTVC